MTVISILILILIINFLQLIVQLSKLKREWQREIRAETRREIFARRMHAYHQNGNEE